jgi:hypothetical protein
MAKKLRDDDAYWRRKLIEQHGEMSEAEMTRAMLDYFVEVQVCPLMTHQRHWL